MNDRRGSSTRQVFGLLAAAVLLGVPLVAYLWETVHQVLALRFEPLRLLVSVPVLALFAGLLTALARRLRKDL